MRIISGILKGKSINFLRNSITRPLKDSVKENIFNIIEHTNLFKIKIKDSNVLDLYSGIGSFGLECISRGANQVKFIEKNKDSSFILERNINYLSIMSHSTIVNENVESFLKKEKKNKYNIIFMDPPFADKLFLNNFEFIKKNKIYKKNHIIIVHRERRTDDNLEDYISVLLVKKYGRSKVIFGVLDK